MFNFDFYNPTRILFGKGRIADLNKQVPQQARVLVLYGGGSVKTTGTLTEVLHALGDRAMAVVIGWITCCAIVALVKRQKDGGRAL